MGWVLLDRETGRGLNNSPLPEEHVAARLLDRGVYPPEHLVAWNEQTGEVVYAPYRPVKPRPLL